MSQLCWDGTVCRDGTVAIHKGLLFGNKKQSSGELSGCVDVKYENNNKHVFPLKCKFAT